MKENIVKIFYCLLGCLLISLVIAYFSNDFSLRNFADLGSYVGIVPLLMASGRLFGGASNDALEDAEHQQRVDATFSKAQPAFDYEPMKSRLPAGVLFFTGITWFVAMQTLFHLWT
jgi:hypothetical protein